MPVKQACLRHLTLVWQELTGLLELDLSGATGLSALPQTLGALSNLEHLALQDCPGLKLLPPGVGNMTGLQVLDTTVCHGLVTLEVSGNHVDEAVEEDEFSLQALPMYACSSIRATPLSLDTLAALYYLDQCGSLLLLAGQAEDGEQTEHMDIDQRELWRQGCSEPVMLPANSGKYALLMWLRRYGGCIKLATLPDINRLPNSQNLAERGCCALAFMRGDTSTRFPLYLNRLHSSDRCMHVSSVHAALGPLTGLQFLNLSMCRQAECPARTHF